MTFTKALTAAGMMDAENKETEIHRACECGRFSVRKMTPEQWRKEPDLHNGCARCVGIESEIESYSRSLSGVPLKHEPALGEWNDVWRACDRWLTQRGLVCQVPQDALIGSYWEAAA